MPSVMQNRRIKRLKNKAWNLLSKKIRRERVQCQNCGSTQYLNVHHLEDARLNPELFLDEKNLILLCVKCHKFGKWAVHRSAVTLWYLINRCKIDMMYLHNHKLDLGKRFEFTEEYLLNKIEELENGKVKKASYCKRGR